MLQNLLGSLRLKSPSSSTFTVVVHVGDATRAAPAAASATPVHLKFARAQAITTAALQSELERHSVHGWRVVAIVSTTDGVMHSAQPSGFFFIDSEAELSPGVYEARLQATANANIASVVAGASVTDEDSLPSLTVPWEDVGRAKVALEALLRQHQPSSDPVPGAMLDGCEQATQPILDFLNSTDVVHNHDFFAVAVSRPEAALRYLVAVSPETTVVAIDAACNRAQLQGLVDPGVPSKVGEFGTANAIATTLANYLPFTTLLDLCKRTENDLVPPLEALAASAGAPKASDRQPGSFNRAQSAMAAALVGATMSATAPTAFMSSQSATGASSAGGGEAGPAVKKQTLSSTLGNAIGVNAVRNIKTRKLHRTGGGPPQAQHGSGIKLKNKDDAQPHRRLIFCGHSVSGTVAHMAAIFARYAVASAASLGGLTRQTTGSTTLTPVRAVTFSSPCFLSPRLMENLTRDGVAADHVTICCEDDPIVEIATLAAEVSAARAVRQDKNADAFRIVAAAQRIVTDSMTPGSPIFSDAQTIDNDVQNATNMARAHQNEAPELKLVPFGIYVFREQRGMMASFTGLPQHRYKVERGGADAVRTRLVHGFSTGKTSNVALRSHVDLLTSRFLANELVAETGITVFLASLAPSVSKCTVTNVANTTRLDFVVAGKNIEPLLGRTSIGGASVPGGKSAFPLQLQMHGDGKDDIDGMFVNKNTTSEARIVTIGWPFTAPGMVSVRTDFGDSAPFTVDTIYRTQGLPPAALLYASINRELLEGAFLRGMLAQTTPGFRRSQKSENNDAGDVLHDGGWVDIDHDQQLHPMIRTIADLENILLNTGETEAIASRYTRPDQIYMARADIEPVVSRMLDFMGKPVHIEFHSVFTRAVQRVVGAFGVFFGAVLTIVGAVALLPAVIPYAVAGAVVMHNYRRNPDQNPLGSGAVVALLIPAVALSIPGGLVAAIGRSILMRGIGAVLDPPSRQYLQMLKLLLIIIGGDPDRCLEEIPSLEAAIIDASEAIIDKPLKIATPKEIRAALDERLVVMNQHHELPEHNVYRRAIDSSRTKIALWLATVGRFGYLRTMFQRQIVLSFVGVHNAGKSTMVHKLFGVDSKADLISRTETVQLFHLGDPQDESRVDQLSFEIADFPGATDERPHIANITQRMGDITTLFVCMFSMGHVAEPERRVVDMIRAKNKDFVVFINKTDAYSDEMASREADLRESYATSLNVEANQIIFTSTKDADRVEYVRKLLFATLSLYVGDQMSPQLAVAMLHPDQRAALENLFATNNTERVQIAVMRTLLDDAGTATPDSVARHLQDVRSSSNAIVFPPQLVQRRVDSKKRISRTFSAGPARHRAAYELTVDLLSRLGYQPSVIMVTLKLMRGLFNNFDQGQRFDFDGALSELTADSAQAIQRPEGQAMLLLIVTTVKHVNEILETFKQMGYEERVIIQTLSTFRPTSANISDITVESLLGEVEFQINKEKEEESRLALPASDQSSVDQRSLCSNDAQNTTNTDPGAEQDLGVLPIAFRIKGVDTLQLLLSRSKFKITDRVRPRALYTNYKPSLSFEERLSMFRELMKTRQAQDGGMDNRAEMKIESNEEMVPSFFRQIGRLTPAELRCGVQLTITGDEAVDAKGVLRSVFTVVAEKLRNNEVQLMTKVNNGNVYFSPRGHADPDATEQFYIQLGRTVGLCLLNTDNNVRLTSCLSLPVCKVILGETLGFNDFEILDPDSARSIRQMCLMDDDTFNDLDLTFSADLADNETYNLTEDGANVPVTVQNRLDYLLARVWFHLGRSLPMEHFVLGVSQAVPRDYLAIFTPSMLQLLLAGQSDFSVTELQAATHYDDALRAHPDLIEWFWQCVAAMSPEDRSLLLAFVTGSSSVPASGVASIQLSMVLYTRGSSSSLPVSHTCFNMLELPPYENYNQLQDCLVFAIRNTSTGQFGLM